MQTALAAAAGKWRAKQEAQRRPMRPGELEALEAEWHDQAERSLRAREAQRQGKRTKRARDTNPAPPETKLWSKPMSLQAATDTRLTMGARLALQAIRSLTARSKRVSRNGLAVLLGVSPRTIQRYIHLLKYRGYIQTRLITNRDGWVIGQIIEITEKVLPPHHRPRRSETMADGLARCVSHHEKTVSIGETGSSHSESKYQNYIEISPRKNISTGHSCVTQKQGNIPSEDTMNSRQYEYGSPELRSRVKALLSKPSPYTTRVRAKAVALLYATNSNRFICPRTDFVPGLLGPRPKGTRADSLILDDLKTAITTGRISIEEIRSILSELFGLDCAYSWDADFFELMDLFNQANS
ncbi:hypothetical protein A6A04_18175 [Paramagnetospirillum marisnigri]|uniref:Uncharacterized protein n=2 Tax=Paramagnetospirillum marisnigri TaxID=1285242 RepID=A0A178MP02_9PROT|nr:hypothetical protein A6A04_18175 [Paramagnetospirillum marisnigri]